MNSTRLRQIEEIYHAVADRAPQERETLVRAACGKDINLRREVNSLLSFEKIANSFVDTSPDAIAAEMFADEESLELFGKTIGHYTIRSLLGVGGMGEVYLADDTLLNRQVALKLVPAALLKHSDQLKRFKQEAQASSALNHPNILTIHEFGIENGTNYIVSELVDGVTLQQRTSQSSMSITEILDVALQVGSALAAAHQAGIIHRDIKLENIMIRRDGIVKVLDFGIAKLTMSSGPDSNAEAQTLLKTAPGIVIGTVAYMSPEQARGIEVDGRTDIWSLGVVIYEMLTGQLPFTGATQTDLLVAILQQTALPLNHFIKNPPVELERIVSRALSKNLGERYQTIQEMSSDLKSFRNRLEFEAEVKRSKGDRSTKDQELERSTGTTTAIMHTSASIRSATGRNFANHYVGNLRSVVIVSASVLALSGMIAFFVWQNAKSEIETTAPGGPPSVVDSSSARTSRTLTYSLTVQSYMDGRYKSPFPLSGEMLFGNRDRVRLNVRSPQTGFLYILNQGPKTGNAEPDYNILFPSPTTNAGSAYMPAGQEIQIPEHSWFELDTTEGIESIWLVWSEKELAELESAKSFANPEDKGRINDAGLNKMIDSILQRQISNLVTVQRDDVKKQSLITGNTDIVAHLIKLEHH